ncbi:MAG: hypothetical protein GDA37_13505 [Ekhidna sp.]|nr:hypothetical protein [Ekhidna sp.]
MKIILTILSLFVLVTLSAQSPKDDEVAFNSAVDWLNSKLDYVYYEKNSGKWWTNTFYINENKEVTIRQISSYRRQTANIKEKTYTIRTFRIQDINPYSIEIKQVNAATGRFAEGELLELHTFDGSDKIHKSIDHRKATSTSFLHLSFPKSLTDSLSNYPQLVRDKFYEAVIASTKVYPIDPNGNKTVIFETLKGTYKSDNGSTWSSTRRFDNILKIESHETEKYFGYDADKRKYFFAEISNEGVSIKYYSEANSTKLVLASDEHPEEKIHIHTFNSFEINGEWYYRL